MIAASAPGILYKAVVYFWAAGPQLVICMWLAYATCRRRHGRLLEWLIGGFAAALLPIAGVLVMIVLFRRGGRARSRPGGAPKLAAAGSPPASAAADADPMVGPAEAGTPPADPTAAGAHSAGPTEAGAHSAGPTEAGAPSAGTGGR